jgi:hypothetical protein
MKEADGAGVSSWISMFPHWPASGLGRQRTAIRVTLIEKFLILQVFMPDMSN